MIVISVSKRWYHPRSEVRQHGKNGAKKRRFRTDSHDTIDYISKSLF